LISGSEQPNLDIHVPGGLPLEQKLALVAHAFYRDHALTHKIIPLERLLIPHCNLDLVILGQREEHLIIPHGILAALLNNPCLLLLAVVHDRAVRRHIAEELGVVGQGASDDLQLEGALGTVDRFSGLDGRWVVCLDAEVRVLRVLGFGG
jgi:hypothetical protein